MTAYRFSDSDRAMLEGMLQPCAVYQKVDDRIVPLILSEGFRDLFGYSSLAAAYEGIGTSLYSFVHPDDLERVVGAADRFMNEDGSYDVVYRIRRRRGDTYQVIHAMGKHAYPQEGVRLAYIWYMDEGVYADDADGQSSAFARSLNNALHESSILQANRIDRMTGLPTMAYFFQLAAEAKAQYVQAGARPVLLYLDLCGMKYFNSKHSFAEGDRLLCSFADLLADVFGRRCCCHIGADHFAAFTEANEVESCLRRLLGEAAAINGGDNLPVHVGVYPNELEDVPVSTACDRAKIACDAIRDAYGSRYNYYDKGVRDKVELRTYILSNLDRAIDEGWVQVYYQPIVRAVSGRVCDEEALARWVDPVRGFLSPDDFIPYLEDAGVLYKLDLYVLDRVLEKIELFRRKGLYVVPQSVNLSRSDFDAVDMVEEVRRRVDAAGVERQMVTIEITESTIGSNFDFMKLQVERFQALGFPVWMDDFGSGYSSLDVLQSIKFNLLKFDMGFLQRLDEGDAGKVILTELMKMATALGIDTVCEGVETLSQVRFLQEIGCSKLQGYYYLCPIPLPQILQRYETGTQIGFEDPTEAGYFELLGRANLYDLAVIANEDDMAGSGGSAFRYFFGTLPMGIIEVDGEAMSFVRANRSYGQFLTRFFGYAPAETHSGFADIPLGRDAQFLRFIHKCCQASSPSFLDERMPDGSTAHFFARRIATNPTTGAVAVAVAVLSVSDADEGATYASIARALATDYYNLYYVDLESDSFIEYTSPVGGEELAMERRGERFFEAAREATMTRIYAEDRASFLDQFTKDNVLRELDEQGYFTTTYRLVDSGEPLYVTMKVVRMGPGARQLIIGVSIVDAQMKQQEMVEKARRDQAVYTRIMALSGDYLSMYNIDPETGSYVEYTAQDEYQRLGLAKSGEDFFERGRIDGLRAVYEEDLPRYLREFTREKVLDAIARTCQYQLDYRLMLDGVPRPVSLKIVPVLDRDGERLVAGVRALSARSSEKA